MTSIRNLVIPMLFTLAGCGTSSSSSTDPEPVKTMVELAHMPVDDMHDKMWEELTQAPGCDTLSAVPKDHFRARYHIAKTAGREEGIREYADILKGAMHTSITDLPEVCQDAKKYSVSWVLPEMPEVLIEFAEISKTSKHEVERLNKVPTCSEAKIPTDDWSRQTYLGHSFKQAVVSYHHFYRHFQGDNVCINDEGVYLMVSNENNE